MTYPIPHPRARQPPHGPYSGRTAPLHATAARLIRDAIAHYPASRVACLDLNDHRQADLILHLIRTAHLDITWPEGDTRP